MAKSAYIHIPFCAHKCDFCDFAAFSGLDQLEDEYAQVLIKEIDERLKLEPNNEPLSTVFFGGGTPGYVEPSMLAAALQALEKNCGIESDAEITMETTPATINERKCREWLSMGIKRISIGIESMHDAELKAMGRDGTKQQAVAAVQNARRFGYENIAVDLMYGLPEQTLDSFRATLDELLALQPDHLSSYGLTIAQSSPLLMQYPLNSDKYPSEETFVQMYALLVETAEAAGLLQYEISNFARPGFESRHNITYWQNAEYLAFGVSAHRYVGGKRSSNFRSLKRYMREYMGLETAEEIDREGRLKEGIFLGLRMRQGLDLRDFARRYQVDLEKEKAEKIAELSSLGLLEIDSGKLRLTQKGILISNSVLAELI